MYQTLDHFSKIGRISSTHGLDGRLHIVHHLKGKQVFKKIPFIFIEIRNQNYIPYKLTSIISSTETDSIITLDGIDTIEKAKLITGKSIYLPTPQYDTLQPKEVTLDFSGFTLYNQYDRKVGHIASIFESPGQLLAAITLENGNEALVPLVEQFILSINAAKKEVTLNIPEGLIEIYL